MMKFKPKDPVPILVISRNYSLVLFLLMIILAIGVIIVLSQIWNQEKHYQLLILLGFISLYMFLFLLFHKLLQYISFKNPVITCYDTYMIVNKKEQIMYMHVFEIMRELRIRGKSYDEFLYIEHEMGTCSFYSSHLESGYYELKSVLHKIPSASHIIFTNKEVDEHWFFS